MKNRKILKNLNPAMTFILLTILTLVLSGILSLVNMHSNYNTINEATGAYENNLVEVQNLFNPAGVKHIITSAASDFVSFAPLSMLIIVLIGIGIMEKTGFLKTFFTIITKKSKKYTVTFLVIFLSMVFTLVGDIGYVIMLPLAALLFKYGKRNPWGGIISSFAAISFTAGINIFLSSTDSSILSLTTLGAKMVDPTYSINPFFGLFIMLIIFGFLSVLLTQITEKIVMPKLPRYEFEEEEDFVLTKRELRGLILGFGAGILYLLLVIYNIIPGLPLSGGLLDHTKSLYIDQIFGENSLFNQGFVFIVTLLFFIVGLLYGLGSRKTKTANDVADSLGYSLDGIGNILVLIFFASIFISTFKTTNIGLVITASFSELLANTTLTGLPLIIILFFGSMICNLFYTGPVLKWAVLFPVVVPVFMNASLSPELAQIIYTSAISATNGLTPLLAYFVIYIAFLNKYRQNENITIHKAFKFMVPYFLTVTIVFFVVIVGWYLTGLPIGIDTLPGVTYVS